MISWGLIFYKILAVVKKHPKRLMLFNTIFIVNIIVNLTKGRLILVNLHLYFTTQILRSVLGTCLLALVKLTIGPLGIYAIISHTGEKPPSE